MPYKSRLNRLFLRSPLTLLLFAVLPGLLVASRLLHLRLPFRFSTEMLLNNVICLTLLVAVRWLGYLFGLRRNIRYGAWLRRPSVGRELTSPVETFRTRLEEAGYRFSGDGAYAEKPDPGYFGSILIYGGLLLLLATGCWENLSQFSGTFLQGLGKAASLATRDIYFPCTAGPFSSVRGLPKLAVTQLNFSDPKNRKGTADIVLLSQKDKPVGAAVLAVGGDNYTYHGFDINLGRLLVDAGLVIKPAGGGPETVVYKDAVKLSPLWKKDGIYSFYGAFTASTNLEGEVYYSPEKNQFKVKLSKNGEKVLETEYPYQAVLHQVSGDYDLSFIAVGRWAEIHVVHHRHMSLIWAGGIIAVLGLAMRLVFRPQRVWLEERVGGCRVLVAGTAAKKLVLENTQAS